MLIRRKLVLLSLAIVITAIAAGLWIAAAKTRARIVQVLGPDSTTESIALHWRGATITGLRGKAPQGWPVEQAFSAERVEVRADLRTVFDETLLIRHIRIEKAYVSVLRNADGKVQFLPGLIRKQPYDPNKPEGRAVRIARIVAHDGDLDWFDATVSEKPARLQLHRVEAHLDDIVVPLKSQQSAFKLRGVLEGEQRNGDMQFEGWVDIAQRNSSVKTRLRGADARTFEPYLIKRAEIGIARGTLDFDLQSEVLDRRLQAPGRLVLSDLDLKSNDGVVGTFMGLQRKAVVGFLKDGDGQIDIGFMLEGDLGDTQFSFHESLTTKIGIAAAEVVGLSVGGVVKGIGTLGQGGVNFIGGALGKVFGRKDEDEARDKDKPRPNPAAPPSH